jgi:MYXO-CTERM domain-containing protein
MIVALLAMTAADAHVTLTFPQPRYGDATIQKDGPCGRGGAMDQRSVNNVTTFLPGETIDILWTETVDHTSHWRVSFDDDGQDFVDPPTEDSYFSNPLVEFDNIPDDPAQTYSQTFTFPLIECSNCTLQVIQVMKDDPNYDPADDIYYNCADIELAYLGGDTDDTDTPVDTDVEDTDVADTDPPADTDPQDTDTPNPPPSDDDDGGCTGGCSGTGTPASLAVGMAAIALAVGRRRRPVR